MLFLTVVLTSVFISYKDITERRIPNVAQYILLLLGYLYLMIHGSSGSDWSGLALPVGIMIFGTILSRYDVIGLGDVKLIFTTLLLIKPGDHYGVLMFIVFTGGIWSIVWHVVLSRLSFIRKIDRVRSGIPYGIPIVLGLCLFTYIN